MVRRHLGGVDDLPPLLPGRAPRRVRVGAPRRGAPLAAAAARRPPGARRRRAGPRRLARGRLAVADHPGRVGEARVAGRAHPGDPGPARLDDRPAVRRPRRHEPAAAVVVRAREAGGLALLAVRAVERGLARRSRRLPAPRRAARARPDPGLALVRGLCRLRRRRRVVRGRGREAPAVIPRSSIRVGRRGTRRDCGSLGTRPPEVPRDGGAVGGPGVRPVRDAGGGDEPPHAGGRGGAAPLDAAPRAVPAVVRTLVRVARRPAPGVAGRAAGGGRARGLRPARGAADGRDAARGTLVRDPLRLRHGGPRRARAPASGGGEADRLLPGDRGGRRARGPAERGRGAARLHGLLGAAPRHPGGAAGGARRRSDRGSFVARRGGRSGG